MNRIGRMLVMTTVAVAVLLVSSGAMAQTSVCNPYPVGSADCATDVAAINQTPAAPAAPAALEGPKLSPVAEAPAVTAGQLPLTGADFVGLAGIAVVLIGIGVGLVAMSRRRRPSLV